MTGTKNTSNDYSAPSSSTPSQLASASNNVMIGFDDDLLAIKDQLCGESSRLEVIPIVGMGGIGKTTLATSVYNDPCIREFFHIGGWATISQSYSITEIVSSLQESLNLFDLKRLKESHESASDVYDGEDDTAEEEAMKVFVKKPGDPVDLYKTLMGRKYLIVMDDIWDTQVWDSLKNYLPNDGNGSRIMLTTRLQDVATYAGSSCKTHEMRLMDEDRSWDLLRHVVFKDGMINDQQHQHQHQLEDIGRAIAVSCGGLPLAVVVIAGLLSTVEKTRASWEEMRKRVNSTVAAKDGKLEKILSLSYTHLPRHLRWCFAYMARFQEDRTIPTTKLIRLWIAEGFIESSTASKSLEEEAEDCLKDLIKRSLVLVDERQPHGKIKSCSLHDVMRELCIRKAKREKFSYLFRSPEEILEPCASECVGYVRVVDDKFRIQSQYLPGRMPGLRYLRLSNSQGIPNLENLQTLIIDYWNWGLVDLPPWIWKMQELRHLISLFGRLPCPQGATSPLENLQTLSKVCNQECSYMLVKMIPNIKKLGLVYSVSHDFLQIYHINNFFSPNPVDDWYDPSRNYDYLLGNLKWLQRLEKLKVQIFPGFQGILNPVFPESLKKLSLIGWRLTSSSHMTNIGSLPNLQVLKLGGICWQDDRWETTEGEFARLSFLHIERSNLRDWVTESGHFPNLKWLLLHHCWQLHEIPMDIGEIDTLELIEITQGSASLLNSARLIEKEQKDMGNDSLQVRCIKSFN